MPEIKLEHVTKRWGKFYAVDDLDLVIQDNAFVTLLGPSGCGKTTTLRMIAGLETPTSGRITIGDQVVFDSALGINIPANKRKVGFLFQNYALWPNMTVYENISFGLKNIKEPLPKVDFEAKNAARLAEILEQPAEVVRVLEECRDKDGRLDQKKAQLKLVDTFTISIYAAKQLLSYRLEQSPDLSGEIASLRGRVEAARQSAAAAGGELDGEFRLVKGGQVIGIHLTEAIFKSCLFHSNGNGPIHHSTPMMVQVTGRFRPIQMRMHIKITSHYNWDTVCFCQ